MDFISSLYYRFPITNRTDFQNTFVFSCPLINHFLYTDLTTKIVSACTKNHIHEDKYFDRDSNKAEPFRELFKHASQLYRLGAIVQCIAILALAKLAGLSNKNILIAAAVCLNGLYSLYRSTKSIVEISSERFISTGDYKQRMEAATTRFKSYIDVPMYDEAFEILERTFKPDEELLEANVLYFATKLAVNGDRTTIEKLEKTFIQFQIKIFWIFLEHCLAKDFKMAEEITQARRMTLIEAIDACTKNEKDRQKMYRDLSTAYIKGKRYADALEVVKLIGDKRTLCEQIQREAKDSDPTTSEAAGNLLSARRIDLF